MRRGLAALVLVTLVATGCGALASTPSASENTLPPADATATAEAPTEVATTTPTPLVIPTTPASPTSAPSVVPSTTATPIPPIPTAGPRPTTTPTTAPTAAPTAAPTPRPTATSAPQPTATSVPTSTPTPTAVPVVPVVSCSISPQRSVAVQETLVFSAQSTPANVPVSFVFDHGDGTLDPGVTSNAYYLAAGTYPVKVRWTTSTHNGAASCGSVTVVASPTCTIGLGPADGLGWWCGDIFCREGASNPASVCPTEAPYGCYIGMDGQQRCIPNPSEWKCLVGQGPADGFVWYCNGQICNPTSPLAGCPPYPIYGCHETVSGPTICIDPAPAPIISCTVSATTATVGQVLVFAAVQTGSQIPVDFVFNHGDGTLDATSVSNAYYASTGTYAVTMTWEHAFGSGQETCGTITVS